MRKVFSGGLMAAALGTALLVAGAMPASAQKEHMSGGGKVSSGGSVSSGGRVSSGATIRGNSSISGRESFRASRSGMTSQRFARNNNNNWDGRRRYHHHRRGDGFSVGFGFGAPYYAYDDYYDSGYYAYGAAAPVDDAVAYCLSRFQSYDPESGTYLGYDGLRHPCP